MAKGFMIIDGQRVAFDGEKNVLAVIRKAGIEMPTFCYHSDLSTYGACRMCLVEDERGKLDSSCSMEPRDGLSIKTNSMRLLKHRRTILELMLASHDCDCTICVCRSWRSSSVCAASALRIPASTMRSTIPASASGATRTSASSAATVCVCARKFRA